MSTLLDYFGLSEKEAAEYVKNHDRDRMQYVRRYFGADVTDPHHYHLVINSGKLGYEQATRIIVEAASRQHAKQAHLLPSKYDLVQEEADPLNMKTKRP